MKSMTQQEKERLYKKIATTAQNWLARGFDNETIAKGIWNRFGYLTEVKNGQVNVFADKQIVVEVK